MFCLQFRQTSSLVPREGPGDKASKLLSWRVQENSYCEKGIFIQLVWKAQQECSSVSGKTTRVSSTPLNQDTVLSGNTTNHVGASNWKSRPINSVKHYDSNSGKPVRNKKYLLQELEGTPGTYRPFWNKSRY